MEIINFTTIHLKLHLPKRVFLNVRVSIIVSTENYEEIDYCHRLQVCMIRRSYFNIRSRMYCGIFQAVNLQVSL